MRHRLMRRLRLMRSRRPLRHLLLWMRCSADLGRRLMSRRVQVPRRLRCSRPLRCRRMSNVRLRRRRRPVVRRCARMGRSSVVLVVRRLRRRLVRSVAGSRSVFSCARLLIILRRAWHLVLGVLVVALRRTRRIVVLCVYLLVVLRRTRHIVCCPRRVRRGLRPVHLRYLASVESARPRRRGHRWSSMVHRRKLGAVIAGRLLVLRLGRRSGKVLSPLSSHLLGCGAGLDAMRTAVVTDAADVDVIDNSLVVHVVNVCDVHVIDGAIVVEIAAVPVSAVVAETWIAKTVVNAAVKSHGWPPETWVPVIQSRRKSPVAGCPKEADFRCKYPRSGHPIISIGAPRPITRCPDVAWSRAYRLCVHRQWRRTNGN